MNNLVLPTAIGVAALVGTLVGASLGSNDEQNARLADRISQLEDRLGSLDEVSTGITGLKTDFAEMGGQMDRVTTVEERLAALVDQNERLTTQVSEIGASTADANEALGAMQTLSGDLMTLGEEVATLKTSAALLELGTNKRALLLKKIGDDGFAMKAGQTTELDGKRFFMSRVTQRAAIFSVDSESVLLDMFGAPIRLSNGCDLVLEGVIGREAFFDIDCAAPAAAKNMSAASETSKADLLETIGEDGFAMKAGETTDLDDQRYFLTRVTESAAVFSVAGKRVSLDKNGLPHRLSNGCSVTLAGVVGREAFIAQDCDDTASANAPQVVAPAAPPASRESLLETIGDDGFIMTPGQTTEIDGQRFFLTRITDRAAIFSVNGESRVIEALGAPLGEAEGCSVSLAGVREREAFFSKDCG